MVKHVLKTALLDQPLNTWPLDAGHDLVAPGHQVENQAAELVDRLLDVLHCRLTCREMAEQRVLFTDQRHVHFMLDPPPAQVSRRQP